MFDKYTSPHVEPILKQSDLKKKKRGTLGIFIPIFINPLKEHNTSRGVTELTLASRTEEQYNLNKSA